MYRWGGVNDNLIVIYDIFYVNDFDLFNYCYFSFIKNKFNFMSYCFIFLNIYLKIFFMIKVYGCEKNEEKNNF